VHRGTVSSVLFVLADHFLRKQMDMITHQAVSLYFIPAYIYVDSHFFKGKKAVFIILKYPFFIDTSEGNMVCAGATFLSRAS
jgi:hypothetical protein